MQFFVPQCHIVLEQAALKENYEIVQVQQKEMQLVQLYRYATHHHSHHHHNFNSAQHLIKELIYHFRDQKMYRFLIELIQKLISKADIIQYTNRNIIALKPHLASQIATLEYAANNINNFPQLIQLRDIIIGYFQTTFQTPPYIINQYFLDLFNEQFIKDIYLTQFNQVHQIQLINYGHPYTPNYTAFTFYLYDDEVYSQVQPQVTQVNTIVTSQYGYQQPSSNPYQSYINQQLNMTDSQYQQFQSQQNSSYQQQQQPQQITYNNYNNQNIYVQPQNPYQNVPQPPIQGFSNNQNKNNNPYSSPPQPQIVGYQATSTSTYNYTNQSTTQSPYQVVQPQSIANQTQLNYQPQPTGYQSLPQPPQPNQIASFPPTQNQIASFPPTQGYQYNLQNNYENKAPQDYQSQQTQAYPNQATSTYQSQNYNNEPKIQQIEQQNNYNISQNQQYNPQNQQPFPYSQVQNESYEQKQLATSQTSQNVSQPPAQSKEYNQFNVNQSNQFNVNQSNQFNVNQSNQFNVNQSNQFNVNQSNQNIQTGLNQENQNVKLPMQDLKQAQSVYSPPIANNNQLEYQNPSNQVQGTSQMVPPPPPPPPPPPAPQQQTNQVFQNQKNINEQNAVSQQESLNFQNTIKNNEPVQNDKSLFEALFLNQSLKNLSLLDNKGAPQIDQKIQFRKDRDIKGFKNHDEHALYILKCYIEGKYVQNKIDRTAEMKSLVSF